MSPLGKELSEATSFSELQLPTKVAPFKHDLLAQFKY
jgi:hypothetical protein